MSTLVADNGYTGTAYQNVAWHYRSDFNRNVYNKWLVNIFNVGVLSYTPVDNNGDAFVTIPAGTSMILMKTGTSGATAMITKCDLMADRDPLSVAALGDATYNIYATWADAADETRGVDFALATSPPDANSIVLGAVAVASGLVNGSTTTTNQTVPGVTAALGGASGYSGFSGAPYIGVSGYSGVKGDSGYSGVPGQDMGVSGYSGESGYSGTSTSGWSGFSGSGVSGKSGYSGATGPTFSTYVKARLSADSVGLLTQNTLVKVPFYSNVGNTDAGWSGAKTSPNGYRWYCTANGIYMFRATAMTSAASSRIGFYLFKNGSAVSQGTTDLGSATYQINAVNLMYSCSGVSGDYYEMYAKNLGTATALDIYQKSTTGSNSGVYSEWDIWRYQ